MKWMLRDRAPTPQPRQLPDVPKVDRHYEAAMREPRPGVGLGRGEVTDQRGATGEVSTERSEAKRATSGSAG